MTFNFTNEELFNPKMNLSDVVVLSIIKRISDEHGFVKNSDLINNTPLSERTIFRCINVLIDAGFLENRKGIKLKKLPKKINRHSVSMQSSFRVSIPDHV